MPRRPLTPVVAGALSILSGLIAAAAGITILLPATPLSAIWAIKPKEYAELLALGSWAGAGFLMLAAICAVTAIGCLRRARWGWWLAVTGLTLNGLSDAVRLVTGSVLEGAIGLAVVALILLWLTRPTVRSGFSR